MRTRELKWRPTHGSNVKSSRTPQGSAHPRFPQDFQMIRVPLDYEHQVLHPSLEMNLRHGLDQSFIPKASHVLGFKILKNVSAARAGSIALLRALLVLSEDQRERRRRQLHNPRLLGHDFEMFKIVLYSKNIRVETLYSTKLYDVSLFTSLIRPSICHIPPNNHRG